MDKILDLKACGPEVDIQNRCETANRKQNLNLKPGVVVHVCSPRTGKVETSSFPEANCPLSLDCSEF